MRASDRSGLAIIIAVVLAALTVLPLTTDGRFLVFGVVLVLLVGGLTIALRRARLGGGSIIAAQLLLVLVFSLGLSLTMPGAGEPWYEHYPRSGTPGSSTCEPSRHRWIPTTA